MRRLFGWLRGGADELGWDDLVRRVVDAVSELRRFGARGRVAFPPQVEIDIVVAAGAVEVVRGFALRSDFDREVAAALANRTDCALADLPGRAYRVLEGERALVQAREAAPRGWQVRIEGGDRHGRAFAVPAGRAEISFGRGDWHGASHDSRNELVVCDRTEFVSRRAGRLHCLGGRLEVEALDQGDFLAVRRGDGSTIRPSRTPSGRVPLGEGEAIELSDGKSGEPAIRLVVERV